MLEAPTTADLVAVRRAGGRVDHVYSIVPAVAATVPLGAVASLRERPRVAEVELDQQVEALDYRETHDWGVVRIRADDVHLEGNTGTGVRVAVIDSGIDCDHEELLASCVLGPTWAEGTTSSDDEYGHGTHVAGTVAAARNVGVSSGVAGSAPSALAIAYRVLDKNGFGSISDVIAALDYVWNNGVKRAEVVNMSLGFSAGSKTFELAVNRAYASGIVLVAAAGNGGRCNGRGDSVSYPAKYEAVIAVAATDSTDARPCWSSTGRAVELAAPGVSVFSTWPEDKPTSARDPQPVCEAPICHYKYGSGTSMSSPHVAGAAALIIAAGVVSDDNGVNGIADEVRARLAATALDLGLAGRDSQYGYGLVDAYAATR